MNLMEQEMAQEQSEASRYKSKYGEENSYCTPQNYIAELVCERLAMKEKCVLPVKFWNTDKWKKTYLMQLLTATSLLKMYEPAAIIAALKKNWKCYSLKAKWLDDDFKLEQEKLNKLKKRDEGASSANHTPIERTTTEEKPREAFVEGKSVKARLRDLD